MLFHFQCGLLVISSTKFVLTSPRALGSCTIGASFCGTNEYPKALPLVGASSCFNVFFGPIDRWWLTVRLNGVGIASDGELVGMVPRPQIDSLVVAVVIIDPFRLHKI